jgi:ADP-ribosylglycohydrolase
VGAVLEFHRGPITAADLDRALSLPGGGVWGVAPGQITDDGELTLAQARALAASPRFDLDRIARAYAQWIGSSPFDIGTTNVRAMGSLVNPTYAELAAREGIAVAMSTAASRSCTESKANGSLMRAVPLGIWGHGLAGAELAEFARRESRLSHPNPSCTDAVACYVLAVAHLVEHPGDAAGAVAAVSDWASRTACQEVRIWLEAALRGERVPFQPQIGFVRVAFVEAFRHLAVSTDYGGALRETLAGGGDTDTNACIVGGLVGARVGVEAIPAAWCHAVLNCDHRRSSHPRPSFLQPQDALELARSLALARQVG